MKLEFWSPFSLGIIIWIFLKSYFLLLGFPKILAIPSNFLRCTKHINFLTSKFWTPQSNLHYFCSIDLFEKKVEITLTFWCSLRKEQEKKVMPKYNHYYTISCVCNWWWDQMTLFFFNQHYLYCNWNLNHRTMMVK